MRRDVGEARGEEEWVFWVGGGELAERELVGAVEAVGCWAEERVLEESDDWEDLGVEVLPEGVFGDGFGAA